MNNNIKLGIYLFVSCLVMVAAQPVLAEEIKSFDSDIAIQADGTIDIIETIQYDFGILDHHGIYRDIPFIYHDGIRKVKTVLSVIDVYEDDYAAQYDVSRSGDDKQIKIGDPDVTIDGLHTYVIHYQVLGAINKFSDIDELYWNVTGNGWEVPMQQTHVTVRFPVNTLAADQLEVSCYQGLFGENIECPIDFADSVVTASAGALQPSEGFTVAVGFPKGLVHDFNWWQQAQLLWVGLEDYLLLALACVFMPLLWLKFGRDPKGRPTVIPQYEPPLQLRPTVIGALIDEKVDNRDITAGIIWLAQQGWLKIERLEDQGLFKRTDYRLTALKPGQTVEGNIEQTIMRALFTSGDSSVLLSGLKKDRMRGQLITALKIDVYRELVHQGLYAHNPYYTKMIFVFGAVVLPIGAIILGLGIIPNIIAGVIILVFGLLLGQKTKQGAEAKDDTLGFKQFLSVTETERYKFHNAPEKNPQQFMEWLPYAIAFGVEKQWAEQFKDISLPVPDWYSGSLAHGFIASQFVNDFGGFTSAMSRGMSAASHQSASGGGGFSGGGFGGGGGGSW